MKRILLAVGVTVCALTIGIAPVMATGTREAPGAAGTRVDPTRVDPTRVDPTQATPVPGVARYASGFTASRLGDLTILTVTRPWQGSGVDDRFTYVLYPRGQAEPVGVEADLLIPVPVERVITMSTTFLPHLEMLGVIDSLVGVDSLAWAYSPAVHAQAARLEQVGSGPAVDIERVLAADADVVMLNSYGGEWDAQPTLEAAGIPVVVIGDWVEVDPLGPAEWLLFTAALFDRLDEAIAVFRGIETEYQRLAERARSVTGRPTVLVNAPFQGTWALSGGASYAASFIRDAGGAYVWESDTAQGSLFYDIESVYEQAGDADVWLNPGVWASLADGRAEDARFTRFKAFDAGQVYNSNRRLGPGGGNDYFESGGLNPHRILADLISIFHPDLLPGHERFYYQQLR